MPVDQVPPTSTTFATSFAGADVFILRGGATFLSDAGSDDGCGTRTSEDGGFPDDLAVELYERAYRAGFYTKLAFITDGTVDAAFDLLEEADIAVVVWFNEFPSRRKLRALTAAVDRNQALVVAVAGADDGWFDTVDGIFQVAVNATTRPGYRETRIDGNTGDTSLFIARMLTSEGGLSTDELRA